MNTFYIESTDGVRIAYDRAGHGDPLILIHGGGSNRRVWHDIGYVQRLKEHFTVITIDLRGHGDSDTPTDIPSYSHEQMFGDILSVADACDFDHFNLWGMSFGGRVCRYLGVKSDRVLKLVVMGAPLGQGVSDEMREQIESFRENWTPIVEAERAGALDLSTLPADEREFFDDFNVPVMLAWAPAMLNWPPVLPGEFRCPTLWLIGSEDHTAMANVAEFEPLLANSSIELRIAENLGHDQTLEAIDIVYPILIDFCLR